MNFIENKTIYIKQIFKILLLIGIVYPAVFALGTLVPMFLMVSLIFIGKANLKPNSKNFKKIEKKVKLVGGLLLIIFGLIDSLIYWFN